MSVSLAPNLSNKTPGSLQLHSFLQMLRQPFQLLLSKTYWDNKPSTPLCYWDPSSSIGTFKLYTWKAFFSTSKNFAIFYLLLFSIKNGNSPIFPKGAILLSPSHPPQNGLKSVFRRTTSSWNIGHINPHEKGQLSCSMWLDVTAKIFLWINPFRNRSLLILETIKHMENTLRTLALYIGGQYLRRE